MIHITNTEIGYDHVLFRISELTLKQGEVYALIGSNGRGKTTFLRTLCGIEPPLSGKIEMKGKDVRLMNEHEMSRTLAFVTPRFEGIEHLSVFDFILLGRTPYLPLSGKPGADDRALADKVIQLAGLEQLKEKYTSRISDGERQLAAICRALAQETDVILLDEPTAFLDYPNKLKVIKLLKRIAKEQNKCILLSSHDLELCLQEDLCIVALTAENELIRPEVNNKRELIRLCFGIDEQTDQHE
ncbi:MAG: ABC transporter ATP-binding protein [Bacteroidota bacterium]|jgi:iron complex transport system ATP-binding protein